jgi:hypothetical protein
MSGLNVDSQRSSDQGVTPDVSSSGKFSLSASTCPCGTSRFHAAPNCPFEISPAALRTISIPGGLTLVPGGGGSPHRPLEFTAPPPIALMTTDAGAVLDLLRYAGMNYAAPDSPAASAALHVFAAGRALALNGPYDAVTFDWDHTFTNNQIFEGLLGVARARRLKSPPPEATSAAAIVAIETPRPFVMELAFGMMVGFAARQGLAHFSDWERYRPQVGIATHTWPDRLGLTALYAPILPLMEGLLPGTAALYERFTSPHIRSVVHLHHFLDYATILVRRFDADGFSTFTPDQADELMGCLEDGGAHRRKPIGTWMARGWNPARLLHIDDSPTLIADLTRQAALAGYDGAHFMYTPHSHSRVFTNVQTWHMLALPSLWRRRPHAMLGVITNLVRIEWARSAVPDLLRRLGHPLDAACVAWPEAALPAGTVMAMYPTPTTVGAFWDDYVAPVVRVQTLIRDVRRRHGGVRAIRRAWRTAMPHQFGAQASRQSEVA